MYEALKSPRIGVLKLLCMAMVLFAVAVEAAVSEPSWPADFDAKVDVLVASSMPSGQQVASVSVAKAYVLPSVAVASASAGSADEPFDSFYCVSGVSSGMNMSSFPVGSVICIR